MTADKRPQPEPQTDAFDPESMAAIRALMASEPSAPAPAAVPRRAQAAPEAAPQPAAPMAAAAPAPQQAARKAAQDAAMEGMGLVDRLKARVLGYRPTAKHIAIFAAGMLLLFRPWLVLGLFFLTAFLITGIFLILGYDGFWRRVMSLARWYARRHPSRSVELHRKLDSFAMRFDAFLDRFPEGTVDGLYLPDFGDLAEAEARHDEALDRRFDNLRETEA